MGEDYETDQLLSDDGEVDREDQNESAKHSLAAVLDVTEEGVSQPLAECDGALEGQSPSGPGSSKVTRRKVVSLHRALKKTWFVRETVMLLRLSVPVVRIARELIFLMATYYVAIKTLWCFGACNSAYFTAILEDC